MTNTSFISDMFKKLTNSELSRSLRHFKTHEKYVNASTKLNLDYDAASREEREMIRHTVERERKRELAHIIYTLILSVLITMILYYTIDIVF